MQRNSLKNLLGDQHGLQNGGPNGDPQSQQKKRKKFKKLKQAGIGVQAFNKLQQPVLQRHLKQSGPNLSHNFITSQQGYRQPDAPPLPFKQGNSSIRSNGPVQIGAYPLPPVPNIKQNADRFPPLTNVSPVPEPNIPLGNPHINGSIGSPAFLQHSNSLTGTSVGNNFKHPAPSKMKAQTAWRKAGVASQFIAKPFQRKSTLEIIDMDSVDGTPEVYESNA